MDLSGLTDDLLDEMRTASKIRVAATRFKTKGLHVEQQFVCRAVQADDREYRVVTRHIPGLPSIFSVGLCLQKCGHRFDSLVVPADVDQIPKADRHRLTNAATNMVTGIDAIEPLRLRLA